MLAVVHSCAVIRLDGYIVDVEVDFNPRAGLPSFTIVGLPDTAVKESRERVRSAIKNSNQATTQRMSGKNFRDLNGLEARRGGQNSQKNEDQGFGLQFVN